MTDDLHKKMYKTIFGIFLSFRASQSRHETIKCARLGWHYYTTVLRIPSDPTAIMSRIAIKKNINWAVMSG